MVAKGTASAALPVAAEENGTPQIISLRSREKAPERKRIACFELDGTVYSIPGSVPTNKALRYAHISRTQGLEAAVDYMLETLLGEEGYAALRDFDDLEEDDLAAIIKQASKVMQGALEAPKGKRKSG